jgi:large subunit ribosomal protein L9
MEVLLIKDVDNLGYAGDVKNVANGYGRNYLLPQGMAVLATTGALKQAETIRRAAEKQRAREMEDAKAIVNQLEGLNLLFERRAGETGKLYGSVTSADIAEAIAEQTGINLDKRKVALPEPVRNLGKQDVLIKLMIDLSTSISMEVLPVGGILERERLTEAEAQALEAAAEAEAQAPVETEAQAPVETEAEVVTEPEAPVEVTETAEAEAPVAEADNETV